MDDLHTSAVALIVGYHNESTKASVDKLAKLVHLLFATRKRGHSFGTFGFGPIHFEDLMTKLDEWTWRHETTAIMNELLRTSPARNLLECSTLYPGECISARAICACFLIERTLI